MNKEVPFNSVVQYEEFYKNIYNSMLIDFLKELIAQEKSTCSINLINFSSCFGLFSLYGKKELAKDLIIESLELYPKKNLKSLECLVKDQSKYERYFTAKLDLKEYYVILAKRYLMEKDYVSALENFLLAQDFLETAYC